MKRLLSAVFSACLLATAVEAATWYVATNGLDSAAGTSWAAPLLTIAAGVTKAQAATRDTVLVSNGVYVVTSQISISKGITVRSLSGRAATIVSGARPTPTSRCFSLSHADAVVDGFTITNGVINLYGGGAYIAGGTVRNCTVSGNAATNVPSGGYGGGVYIAATGGVLSNCTISGNSVVWLGGGLCMAGGRAQKCIISGNRATGNNTGQGGGVYLSGGLLSGCTISGNTVAWYGSGISSAGGVVEACVISNNTATGRGGAVYFGAGTLRDCLIVNNNTPGDGGGGVNFWSGTSGLVSNCVITGNTCAGGGGGVYVYGSSGWVIRDCTIASNSAASGAGIFVNNNTPLFTHCRISRNLALTGQGGGVFSGNSATPIFRNCLIDGNRATNHHGGGLCVGPATIESCTIASNQCRMTAGYVGGGLRSSINGTVLRNSIIFDNRAGTAGASNYTIYIAPISVSNCCLTPALTGTSTNYSGRNTTAGPRFVDRARGDFRVTFGSPCVDAGRYEPWMAHDVDLDHRPRIQRAAVDMGAYELALAGTAIVFY